MVTCFKWVIHYLDQRYRKVIGMVGLGREKMNFPLYARSIARKINQVRHYVCPITGFVFFVRITALFDENSFRIFSFLDGSYFRTNTAGSGPAGDYEGAMRQPNWYIMQRAIYNSYKRLHGIHILSIMLPNGINYIYGPSPERGGDHSAMMHSGLNNFLEELQRGLWHDMNGNEMFYATHGDMLFHPQSCVSRNHRPQPNAPLTVFQIAENYALNLVRISIEHSYGYVQNKLKILSRPGEFKLAQEEPHAVELLRVVMLYANINVCLNGMQVGCCHYFNCHPPSLEDYLRID